MPDPTPEPTPERARVILYACTTIRGNATRILDELRAYAIAQRWVVIASFEDRTGAAPEKDRKGFLAAKELIETGHADGIVTRYPAMAAYHQHERDELTKWLAGHGAWLRTTWKPSQVLS